MVEITVIGGGLAGCEAAFQAACLGCRVRLFEQRPHRSTEAHRTGNLAELVCSNSLRSDRPESPVGALKQELRIGGSVILAAADAARVPAGQALAVDRAGMSAGVEARLAATGAIEVVRGEVTELPGDGVVVVATGPLTSAPLAEAIQAVTGAERLYFYDAIAPIVAADSVDPERCFTADRYGKGDGDYLNCGLDAAEYRRFYEALMAAERVPLADFETPHYFEGCLPIEVLAERGVDTLRFGPMKPVGLTDPHTGRQPYAALQLRAENRARSAFNLVGFQTKLTYPAQEQVFRLIPGLAEAELLRLGSIHRNTYLDSPRCLTAEQEAKARSSLFFAGQMTGVEGYVESTCSGWLAGVAAARRALGLGPLLPPRESSMGAMLAHTTGPVRDNFQPSNIHRGLYPPLADPPRKRRERRTAYCTRAIDAFARWHAENFAEVARA
jgi:methylenetetrahydrofolate--tRNA-(uracil-5-)-methyltransferase